MVLVLEPKFLEGRWWKYGLGLGILQVLLWMLLGYALQGKFEPLRLLRDGTFIWSAWLMFGFLPFVLGRFGLRRLFWCAIVGFVLGDLAYFGLAIFEPVRLMNPLIPFIAFIQLNAAFISLGILIEFGRYVYRRVFEE